MRRSRTGEESNSLTDESKVSWSCDDNDNENTDNDSENNINKNIETRSLSRNYRKIKVLKRGSQGVVYLARDRNHSNNDDSSSSSSSCGGGGVVVAVKRMFTDSREEALRGIPEGIIREIGILKQVQDFSHHKNNNNNIVRFHDVVFASTKNSSSNQAEEEICLVLEACTDGDISQLVINSSPVPLDLILSITYDCLKALDFLHNKMSCIHRDIKPSNILLRRIHHVHHDVHSPSQSMMEAVLSDLGSARKFDGESLTEERDDNSHLHSPGARRTTLCYRPPEILLGARTYTTAVDIWGVAIVMIELFKGSHLFQTNSEMQMISQLFTVFGQPTSTTWPGSEEQYPLLKAFSFSQNPQAQERKQEQETEMREKSNKHLRAHLNHWKSQKRKSEVDDDDDDEAGKKKFDLFSDLLEKMTTLDPQARISARDALSHPCFSSNFSPDTGNFFSLWKSATTTTAEGPGQQKMMMAGNLGGAMQGSAPRPPPSVVGALKLQLGESESEED